MVTHMRGTYIQQVFTAHGGEATYDAFVPSMVDHETLAGMHMDAPTASELARAEAQLLEASVRMKPFAALANLLEGRASARNENYDVLLDVHLRERETATKSQLVQLNESNVELVEAALVSVDTVLTTDLLHAWHGRLFHGVDLHQRDWVGRPRTRAVWIGSGFGGPMNAAYVAPPAPRVPGLLDNLTWFDRECRPASALATAGMSYVQFETVHPYSDGNGRVGRALMQYLLARAWQLQHAVLVSPSVVVMHRAHLDLLIGWREGDDPRFWRALIDIAQHAARVSHLLVDELQTLQATQDKLMQAGAVKEPARRLARMFWQRPLMNMNQAAQELGMSRPAARRALDSLVAAGVIDLATPRRARNLLWANTQLVDALEQWECRCAVRQH